MMTLVGAGAVGTTLATALAAAGTPLRLYARDKDRASFIAAGGLRLQRPGGRALTAPLPPLTSQLVDADTRYLLLATKFAALEPLIAELQGLPAHITLVSALNGVQAVPLLHQAFPTNRVVPLTIMFNAQHTGPLQAQLTTKSAVILASDDDRLRQLLRGTALKLQFARGEAACWGKLLINLGNAIGALTQSTFRDLLSDPDLRAIYVATLDEAIACIAAAGIDYQLPMPIPYAAYRTLLLHGGPLPWWLARLRNGLDDGAYPSMVSDVRAGRTTEVRQLNGEIVSLGQRLGRPAPVNAALTALVESLSASDPRRWTPAALRNQLALPSLARGR